MNVYSAVFALLTITLLFSCSRPAAPVKQEINPPYNRLLFAGDVMFSREVRRDLLASHDPAMPFRKIAPILRAADISFINLETPFSDQGPYYEHGLIFHAAPQFIAGLELAHVALASTANNHARDCGPHGVMFTVNWLRAHGIQPVGSSESAEQTHKGVVLVRKGIRFGFLGYTYDQSNGNWRDVDDRIALTDEAAMRRDVQALRKGCDVVIVSMHNGIEYMPRPNAKQISFAHAAINAGATLVVGHHPHVTEPTECYRGGEIFYSLGNFVFDQYQRVETQHGEMAEVSFLGTRIFGTKILPVRITPSGPELEANATGADARHQTGEEFLRPSGGGLDTATVLRGFPKDEPPAREKPRISRIAR
ncbi:MAG TPA: CapA family protein [Bryobacteraceae bacterium]|nr:CapA family protein [Bryobacteraceae bacterium]